MPSKIKLLQSYEVLWIRVHVHDLDMYAFHFFRNGAAKGKDDELPSFDNFFKSRYDFLEKMYGELMDKVSLMAPLLIKVEEILVATRTRRAPRLSSYYLHWEKKLFEAVGKFLEKKTISVSFYSYPQWGLLFCRCPYVGGKPTFRFVLKFDIFGYYRHQPSPF